MRPPLPDINNICHISTEDSKVLCYTAVYHYVQLEMQQSAPVAFNNVCVRIVCLIVRPVE